MEDETNVISTTSTPGAFDNSYYFCICNHNDLVPMQDVVENIVYTEPLGLTINHVQKEYTISSKSNRMPNKRLVNKLQNVIDEIGAKTRLQVLAFIAEGNANSQVVRADMYGSDILKRVIHPYKELMFADFFNILKSNEEVTEKNPVGLFTLPQLNIDGYPIPLTKLTQAQLRSFIPVMMKYATGRAKPGWGKINLKPDWWPERVPFKNVRMDIRSEEEKLLLPWTEALRLVVSSCYKFFDREDLLNTDVKLI
ncbi:unnamed protein product [Brassicogethes aeneus]|uniref:Nuclear respiratory factor 1 NLS/DNA-binding dimerisation domain-containing protein n=1 Tax=Brassicogethes aeneus TaxID=1431903 RepID=A0A9P0BBS6_BRAAE|nr:unnamed protein product [Brassicogethes aeneus]